MALKQPSSAEECVYLTRRIIGNGKATVWVFKDKCPKCKGAIMGKPRGPDGKVKIRAKEYICPKCNHTIEKQAYEDTLTANIEYTCPNCSHSGEKQIPFQRKKIRIADEAEQKKKSIETLQFECDKCKQKINITKKMK